MNIQPWHWLVFGLILMTLEMFVPTFFMLWFGAAAVITALISWIMPMSLAMTIIIWLVLSVILCILWFKLIQPNIKTRTTAGLGGSVIIGETGILTYAPTSDTLGKVRFNVPKVGSDEWLCRGADGEMLQAGDRVVVVQVLGNELVVRRK